MIWFALAASGFLLVYAFVRARRLGPLFSDEHLVQVAALLPELKQRALARTDDDRPSGSTPAITLGDTIREDEGMWVHHLSVSSPVTPARAAGTFFLGMVRGALGIAGSPAEVFVSQNQVFHLIVRLSEAEQEAFVARPVDVGSPIELREMAIAGRGALLPRLVERAVPATVKKS